MNRLIDELAEEVRLRWEATLTELSEPAQSTLTGYLEHEVLPTVRHDSVDFVGLWTEFPQMFERWRNPPDREQLLESLREQHDATPQQSGSLQFNAVAISGGTPEWERMCVGQFVHWMELPLAKQLANEHGLDTSDALLEAFLRERKPGMLQFDGLTQAREREIAQADALQAIVDGADPGQAYLDYRLDRYSSADFWETYAAHVDQRRVDQARSAVQRLTPEHLMQQALKARWNRFAYWEDQLVDRLFPQQCHARDGMGSTWHSRKVLDCLDRARAFYIEYAANAIGEAPPGWQEHLLLFRPQPQAASPPGQN